MLNIEKKASMKRLSCLLMVFFGKLYVSRVMSYSLRLLWEDRPTSTVQFNR